MGAALAATVDELLPGSGDFVAIDFETADAGRDSACSIGVVRVEGDQITGRFSSLLRPPRPSSLLTHVHGISEAAQRAAPELRAVWPQLAPLLAGAPLFVAHNAPFDMGVARASFGLAGVTLPGAPWACTVKMARALWPKSADLPDHKLDTLARRFGITLRHHQADSDAEACARLVLIARAQARGEEVATRARPKLLEEPKAPAPRAAPAPPPPDPTLERALGLVDLGRDCYQHGGDPDQLQAELGGQVARVLVSLGWLVEHLDSDLRAVGRGAGVRVESRLDALAALLRRPHNAPVNFVEMVAARERERTRSRADWRFLSAEQKAEQKARLDALDDQVHEALGRLAVGGRA